MRLTVDALVINERDEIVLVKRKHPPYEGQWALPGGFVEENETVENALIREMREELDIDVSKSYDLVGVYSEPDRDPRGRTVTLAFICWVDRNVQPNAGDDAGEAKFFDWNDVYNMNLAFDHDRIFIENIRKAF